MRTIKAGQDRARERGSMSTVKSALAQKSGTLTHVRSDDMVVEALRQMRDNRVRSVLVIDDDVLVGIVTQGDCAIKVLLPGLDAKRSIWRNDSASSSRKTPSERTASLACSRGPKTRRSRSTVT